MNLVELRERLSELGCRHALIKSLAENDNSKNQIYLGGNFEAVNVLPHGNIVMDGNHAKADLDLAWLTDELTVERAPNAKLILYPQYPEVRMSGFLKGARGAPSALLNQRLAGRKLILGVRPSGSVVGWVCAPDHEVARELRSLELAGHGTFQSVFFRLEVDGGARGGEFEILKALRDVHEMGWVSARRLNGGRVVRTNAQNSGGYTLEALLGVEANSVAGPDFIGWELKAFTAPSFDRLPLAKLLTVITPEPKEGFYATDGVESFVRRYGYADRRGRPDRLNFGGQYRVGKSVAITRLTMQLVGYESAKGGARGKITDLSEGAIQLVDETGNLAAAWPFLRLLSHWETKHAQAAYVPAVARLLPDGVRQFQYGSSVSLGRRTDFLLFLEALHRGLVVYDPGIKLEGAATAKPSVKRRSQFRIRFRDLENLYADFEERSVYDA